MKKILFVLFLLVGCTNVNNVYIENESTTILNNNYYKQPACVMSDDTVVHNESAQISMFVEDGRLRFIDDLYNNDFYMDEFENVRFVADNADDNGIQYFLIVTDTNIFGFEISERDEELEFTRDNFYSLIHNVNPEGQEYNIPYDGDLSGVLTCEDTKITSSYYKPQFYGKKADGNLYLIDFNTNEISQPRSDLIPFKDFYYLDENLYLMSMNDLEVKLASNIDEKVVYSENAFVSDEGNSIKAEFLFVSFDDNVIHLIENNGSYYQVNAEELKLDKKVTLTKNAVIKKIDLILDEANMIKNLTLYFEDETVINFEDKIYLFTK